MSIGQRSITGRLLRSSLLTAVAAVLSLALVAPALAVSGPTRLSDPDVTPRSAHPSDVVVFSVTYRNREGSPPDEVRVAIDGAPVAMSPVPGDVSWKSGVRFTYATSLPVGTHTVVFSATDREKFTDEIAGGSVTVVEPPPAPSPPPTPEPTAPPPPTPEPTAPPPPTASPSPPPSQPPTPAPTAAAPTSAASPGPLEPAPGADAAPSSTDRRNDDPAPARPADSVPGSADPDGSTPDDPDGPSPADPGGPYPADPDDPPAVPDGGVPDGGTPPGAPGGAGTGEPNGPVSPGDPSGGSAGDGWGDFARALEELGIDAGQGASLRVMTTLVGTTGGVTLVMAFMFFGKKRRDGEPSAPDEVLHASAARGAALPSAAMLVAGPGPAVPVDLEASMPRWRRPSLLQARKTDPLRDTSAVRATLSFDHGIVGPVDGHERRIIRYRAVRLLDAPDELRSAEIGFLDQGDEVQLLERSGAYWLVLCPDGRRGWLHKMTLGDVVGEPPGPGPRETWATESMDAGSGVDDDVLTAFLAARGRA